MRSVFLGLMLFLAVLTTSFGASAEDSLLMKMEPLTIATEGDASMFTVEIADTEETRTRGLMFRQRLPQDRGMLFDFGQPRPVGMWMKNTYIPLDMFFIRSDGTIAYVAENTVPQSLDVVGVNEPVRAVLELAAGSSKRLGISAGDTVYHRLFKTAE